MNVTLIYIYIFAALDFSVRLIHDINHPFTRFNLVYLSGFAAIFIVALFILTNVHKVTYFIQFLWLTIGFRKRIFFTIVPTLIKSNSIEKLDFEMQYAIHLFVASMLWCRLRLPCITKIRASCTYLMLYPIFHLY